MSLKIGENSHTGYHEISGKFYGHSKIHLWPYVNLALLWTNMAENRKWLSGFGGVKNITFNIYEIINSEHIKGASQKLLDWSQYYNFMHINIIGQYSPV